MEPKVKERVVGAAVLVALGVWLIPWVLDGPEDAPELDSAADLITLPSTDEIAPLRSETVELAPRPERNSELPDASAQAVETQAVAVVISEPDAAPASAGSATRAPTASSAASTARTPSTAPPATGGWSVQLGAFSDPANAQQLVSRVGTFGYAAQVFELRSGDRTIHRVRVVGFPTENAADAAASALAAHNFNVDVISPE